MEPLERVSGTLVNAATVVAGTTLGLLARGRMSERHNRTLLQVLGLVTLTIGVGMAADLGRVAAGRVPGVILALVALALGAALGETLRLEERLEALGEWLKARVGGTGSFTQGFVTASLLFCVGPMTVVGSLQNGLAGDARALLLKAALDGIASVALTGAYGAGVGASVLTVLVVQGGISLGAGGLAALIPDPASDPRVLLVTGAGGILIAGIAVNLLLAGLGLDASRVRVGAMLPALALAPVVYYVASLFG